MKALPFRIPMIEKSNFLYQEYTSPKLYNQYHIHDEIQLTYILKGEGEILVGNKITHYQTKDLIVLGGQLPHAFKTDNSEIPLTTTLSFYLNKNSFGNFLPGMDEMQEMKLFLKKIEKGILLRKHNNAISNTMESLKQSSEFERFITLLQLIKMVVKETTYPLSTFQFDHSIQENTRERMKRIIDHTFTHYQNEILISEVAAVANLNPNSFCRYFKKHTNKTYFEFLIEVRLNHAVRLLNKANELSIEGIAELSGFRNMSNFYRKFKVFKQCTPFTYRKKVRSMME